MQYLLSVDGPAEIGELGSFADKLDTADGVNLPCAFLKWQGIRVISAELQRLRERRVPLRASSPPTSAQPSGWRSSGWSRSSRHR